MTSSDVVVKTPEGLAELKSRARKLPQRLRTMLIMIDGRLNVAQLQRAAAGLGVAADFLDVLEQQGLIALDAMEAADTRAPAATETEKETETGANAPLVERFRAAQRFMNDTVVDALGFRAFFFTLKLEKCFTLADLRLLLPDFRKLIAKGSGEDVARVLDAWARELLD